MWVCGYSLAGTASLNSSGDMDTCLAYCVLSVRVCDGPIPPTEESYRLWYVIVYDLETSRIRRLWPALGCCAGGMPHKYDYNFEIILYNSAWFSLLNFLGDVDHVSNFKYIFHNCLRSVKHDFHYIHLEGI